jgi:hypothetical protein
MAEFLSDLLTETITNNRRLSANYTGRGGVFGVEAKATVLAAHSDGDIYRLLSVPSNAIPLFWTCANSAITSGTDYDLGIYNFGASGTVLDKDVLNDGISMATASIARIFTSPHLIADFGKRFWELAGLSADPGGYLDICWTANTVGSADGTIAISLLYNANN